MNALAGWVTALLVLLAYGNQARRHAAILELLEKERRTLWDQLERWEPIVAAYAQETEARARQAVTN